MATVATIVYVLGAGIAFYLASREHEREFGKPKDFLDFFASHFFAALLAFLWPLFAVVYLIWIPYRKRVGS